METQQQWSRRKVIATFAGVGTTLMVNPFLSWADDEVDPRIARIVAKTIGVDTHNHIDVPRPS